MSEERIFHSLEEMNKYLVEELGLPEAKAEDLPSDLRLMMILGIPFRIRIDRTEEPEVEEVPEPQTDDCCGEQTTLTAPVSDPMDQYIAFSCQQIAYLSKQLELARNELEFHINNEARLGKELGEEIESHANCHQEFDAELRKKYDEGYQAGRSSMRH